MSEQRVAAVVVNYKAKDHALEAVRSLRAEGLVDIVVADNASGDGVGQALEQADPEVMFVQTGRNLGYGTGVNRGVAALEGDREFVLACNADVIVEPGSVKAMIEALDRRPEVGIVGPRIEEPGGTLYPSARTFPNLLDSLGHAFLGLVWPNNSFTRRYRMLDWDHAAAAVVDWVSGSCFMIRRSTWRAINGFDESYFMYAEDVDLCWRAHQAGWKVAYEPAARVLHHQGVSTAKHPYRMILEHHRALLRFAVRTTKGPQRALLPVVAAGLAVRVPLAWLKHRRDSVKRPASN